MRVFHSASKLLAEMTKAILLNLMHSIGSHPYGARCLKVGGVYGIHEQESLANAR